MARRLSAPTRLDVIERASACNGHPGGSAISISPPRTGQTTRASSPTLDLRLSVSLVVDMASIRLSGSHVSNALRSARAAKPQIRCLATPSSSKTSFSQTLDDGPSLDDFIADRVPDRVVLGNAKAYVL